MAARRPFVVLATPYKKGTDAQLTANESPRGCIHSVRAALLSDLGHGRFGCNADSSCFVFQLARVGARLNSKFVFGSWAGFEALLDEESNKVVAGCAAAAPPKEKKTNKKKRIPVLVDNFKRTNDGLCAHQTRAWKYARAPR